MTVLLDSSEPCLISVAQAGVRVKKSRWGFLGATLYEERNVHRAAQTAMALDELFSEMKLPVMIRNPVLRAFANAVWCCPSAAAVAVALNRAQEL